MKKLAIALMITIIGAGALAQSPDLPAERCLIVKKNNKLIKKVKLWSIGNTNLEYEKEGSLHDVPLTDIAIIKTDNEILSFDVNNKLVVKPYDLIFTRNDTIRCQITRVSASSFYYIKRKGNNKHDYIISSEVRGYIKVNDTLVFDKISNAYYKFIHKTSIVTREESIQEEPASVKEATSVSVATVSAPDTSGPKSPDIQVSDDSVKVDKYAELKGPIVKKPEKEEVLEEEAVKPLHKQETGPMRKFYADKYGNNDLIITKSGRAIICIIDKVSDANIYFHIIKRGADYRNQISHSSTLQYFDNTTRIHSNTDTIILNSGKSITCKITDVKNGRIYFTLYKRGPETRSSFDLKYVTSYEKRAIGEFPESQLISAQKKSALNTPMSTSKSTGAASLKINPGMVIGQLFAGTGVGLAAGGIGFFIGSIGSGEFSTNSTNLAGYTIGSTIGATVMVAAVGLSSKNTKSNFGATLLGAFIGSLGGMLVMNKLSEIDSFEGQVVGAAAGGMLSSIGAIIGHQLSRKPKELKFDLKLSYNGAGLTYYF